MPLSPVEMTAPALFKLIVLSAKMPTTPPEILPPALLTTSALPELDIPVPLVAANPAMSPELVTFNACRLSIPVSWPEMVPLLNISANGSETADAARPSRNHTGV
jgi:hypothetical protein